MDLTKLEFFQKAAETENLSTAAEALAVTQPTLSKSIKALEAELGLELFTRQGRSMHLNENGRIFKKYTDEVLLQMENARMELGVHAEAKRKNVQISMMSGSRLLPELIVGFRAAYPDFNISLIKAKSPEFAAEESDLVIHTSDQLAEEYPSIIMFEERCMIGMSKTHRLASFPSVPIEELTGEDFLLWDTGRESLEEMLKSVFRGCKSRPDVVFECDSQYTIASLAEMGMGVTIVPCITWEAETKQLILKNIRGVKMSRRLYISWRKGSVGTPAAEAFKRYAGEYFSSVQQRYSEECRQKRNWNKQILQQNMLIK